MPIELLFADQSIRDICERQSVADSKLGARAARRLRARLADLRAARSVAGVAAGWPKRADASDHISFTLHPSHQLVLEPANEPIPRESNGEVMWLKVNRVRVVYVGKLP